MFGSKKGAIDRSRFRPSADNEATGKESRHPTEKGLDGTRIITSFSTPFPKQDTANNEADSHNEEKDRSYIFHLF